MFRARRGGTLGAVCTKIIALYSALYSQFASRLRSAIKQAFGKLKENSESPRNGTFLYRILAYCRLHNSKNILHSGTAVQASPPADTCTLSTIWSVCAGKKRQ